jgi:hypothetical protein
MRSVSMTEWRSLGRTIKTEQPSSHESVLSHAQSQFKRDGGMSEDVDEVTSRANPDLLATGCKAGYRVKGRGDYINAWQTSDLFSQS